MKKCSDCKYSRQTNPGRMSFCVRVDRVTGFIENERSCTTERKNVWFKDVCGRNAKYYEVKEWSDAEMDETNA
jgi:hypothetical protein